MLELTFESNVVNFFCEIRVGETSAGGALLNGGEERGDPEGRGREQHPLHTINSFCKSRFPHKFVNLFFVLEITKAKSTDLCGN